MAGGVGAAVFNRAMTSMVYGVRTGDPLTFAIAGLSVFAATIAACVVPASRAARLDPTGALRSE